MIFTPVLCYLLRSVTRGSLAFTPCRRPSNTTFQTTSSPCVSLPRNHVILFNFDPHIAASWMDTETQLSCPRSSHVDEKLSGAMRYTTSSQKLMFRLEIIVFSTLILIGDEHGQLMCCFIILKVSLVNATVQCCQYVARVALVSRENMYKNSLRTLNIGKVSLKI
jgi:hypothetical protein